MIAVPADQFAAAMGITVRAAQMAFAKAVEGKNWRGLSLPVVPVTGQRGGAGGTVYALDVDRADPGLRALLNLPQLPAAAPLETALEAPVQAPVKTARPLSRPTDAQLRIMRAKADIVAPILEYPKGSPERAAAVAAVAAVPHDFAGEVRRFAASTLRQWAREVETRGDAAMLPKVRRDKGRKRYHVTRLWDSSVGLDDATKARIAAKLDATAKGVVADHGWSHRMLCRVLWAELRRLSAEAGSPVPLAKLKPLCKLNRRWAEKFRPMRVVYEYDHDHKSYSDKHEARVKRTLAARPWEVTYGDVHHVDIVVAPRNEPVRAKLIAWWCGATHFMFVTVVLVNDRKGITQEDVARSLFDLTQSPIGGMPKILYLDNGGEYAALEEAAARFAALSGDSGALRIVKAKPYSPQSKGGLEGAFDVLEDGFLRNLPGWIAGDRMNAPTKSKGRPVDAYPHGLARLLDDIHRAVDLYNGMPQEGRLGGLSPRAKLQELIDATGWAADRPDPDMFDLVFSREERRDVRNGLVTIDNRALYGEALVDMSGERQVPILVPLRDPHGPAILFRDGVIHRLHPESFGQVDGRGAKRQAQLAKAQKAAVAHRRDGADRATDPAQLVGQVADLDPVRANPPNEWNVSFLDKTGKLSGPRSEEEARAAEEDERRSILEDFLAHAGGERRAINGGQPDDRSSAT